MAFVAKYRRCLREPDCCGEDLLLSGYQRGATKSCPQTSLQIIHGYRPKLSWRGPGVPTVSSGLGGPQTVPWPELAELEPLTSTHMQATHQDHHRILLEDSSTLVRQSANKLPSSPARPRDVVIQICTSLFFPVLSTHLTLQLGRQKCPSQYEDEPPVITSSRPRAGWTWTVIGSRYQRPTSVHPPSRRRPTTTITTTITTPPSPTPS